MRSYLWPLGLLLAGLGMWRGLIYLWQIVSDAQPFAVFTIFPMMGTPYILATAFVCLGLQGLWEAWRGRR